MPGQQECLSLQQHRNTDCCCRRYCVRVAVFRGVIAEARRRVRRQATWQSSMIRVVSPVEAIARMIHID